MKIEDSFSPSSDLRSQHVSRTPETQVDGRGAGRRSETAKSDTANISALSAELARAIEQEPPETVARIERLQEAIGNGTYDVSSKAVASKIVAVALGASEGD